MAVLVINNQAEFDSKVVNSAQPVLVDFWATWCGPCKMVAPEVEAVSESYADKMTVAKVNIDELSQIAGQYSVMSIPTMVLFNKGKEVTRIVGYRPRKDIADAIDRAI